jgi:hypothetical protein
MNLTDKEEFSAIVQLVAAILSQPSNSDATNVVPPDLRRAATLNEAYHYLHAIAGRVTDGRRGTP